ncbi:MAG: SusD/RagB family nutrient-binding outer membrane lipoprotein [Bacteroides sp.]
MKKITTLGLLITFLTGCSLDINTDPNYPAAVTPSLVFPAIENSIAVVVGDGMYNYAGFYAQYYDQLPEANQYNDLTQNMITESSQIIDRSYTTLYARALEDVDVVLKSTASSTADKFAATALRAFSFQLLVDNMDQVPYTEALLGSANPTPKWDGGQSVYEGVLAELDKAEQDLSGAMTCNDLLLNKNVTQWKGFANALRLRMYLRFIDAGVDAAGYTSKLKALVDKGMFFTGDVKYDVFSDQADKRNPWYAANKVNLAMNHAAAYPIITYQKKTNDPRIAYNFVKATKSKDYAGEIPGSKTNPAAKNADYSFMKYYATKPVYFFTQGELQFLLAEVYLRFYSDDTRAKKAYEAAIDADFEAREMAETGSVMYGADGSVAWSSAKTNETKLELIYMQKWVALCYMDHMEAWSEIRRTDCPKPSGFTAAEIMANSTVYTPGDLIAPLRNGFGEGSFAKRMFFPQRARQLNPNTPPSVPATTPVWWDKK